MTACELCATPGGEIVWHDESCRVLRVGGAEGLAFPGFCRIVWNGHVAEMTELTAGERRHLMNVVFATEVAVRQLVQPDKINLASLGNVVPHLHWHVIPRWRDDSHFPAPIWAREKRPAPERASVTNAALGTVISEILAAEVSGA